MKTDYEKAIDAVSNLPHFYLGQEVETEHGIGIIVELNMEYNGLYLSPERSKCVVWFSTETATPWVNREYRLLEIKSTDQTSEIQKIQDEIKKWSDETFGKYRNGSPMINHLKREIDELINAMGDYHRGIYSNSVERGIELRNKKIDRIKMELADCFILLFDSAAHEQININGIVNAIKEKLEINKKRKWGRPDENGIIEHISE
jgi:hypothetical protein